MPEAEIAKAVQLLDVMLEHFADDGLKGGGLMALAGLWETWRSRSSGEHVRSFAIVTTEPNELCALVRHFSGLHWGRSRAWSGRSRSTDS